MSIETRTSLIDYANTYINTNGANAITGEELNTWLINMADSAVNKSGDTGILGVLRYASLLTFSNDADLVNKKYVDDKASGNIEITDAAVILLLEDPITNWTDNIYTGTTPITGYNSGDFYISNTHDYKVFSSGTKIRRIPYAFL